MKFHIASALFVVVLLSGCGGSGSASTGATPTLFNAAGAPTVQFSVPDMMCVDGCAMAVKEILAKQPGVKDVLVDFDAKTATVAVDEGTFDAEQALSALFDKRFDNSSLKGETATVPAGGPAAIPAAPVP